MATETRVTDWVSVEDRPAWANSGISAYRIWQQRAEKWGFQRHEWKLTDGRIDLEDWIEIPRNFAWSAGARVVTDEQQAA